MLWTLMLLGVPLGRDGLTQVQAGWTGRLHSSNVALGWAHGLAVEG